MKNLITYLSKKCLSLGNDSGMTRQCFGITSTKSRNSLDPILSRLCLASLICLFMLTLGVGNAWGVEYEYIMITDPSEVTAGTYVVGALRSESATNNFYFGKATVSSGDWVVSDGYVTVAAVNGIRKFDASSLPSGAVEFTFTGNNTDGFTIANGSNYLYYTTNSARKLAFASTGSTYKWTVASKSSPLIVGGVVLKKKSGGEASNYTISENATSTTAIRGYNTTTQYRAIYLFKKQEKVVGDYVLVENAGDIGPGQYLIVYNNTNALNTHYDAVNTNTYGTYTNISSYYSNKKIASNATTDALAYIVTATTHGYSIKRGEFLGNSSNSTGSYLRWDNTFTANQNEWTLGVNSIVSARNSSYAIRWNNGSPRFAIYGPTGQQPVQLFKKVATASCDAPTGLTNGAHQDATTGNNGSQVVSWSGSAANYDVCVNASNSVPTSETSPDHTGSATSYTISGKNPGNYRWWVRSNCGGEKSDWVEGTSFTIKGIKTGGTIPVAFGTVGQGSTVAAKTITVTGIGLTSGTSITATFPSGSPFSVDPTSVAYNADHVTLTISASTANVGAYDQNLTLSYGGTYTATVKVTMTVVAVDRFIDVLQNTAGYEEATPHTELGTYSTPTLPDKSAATEGTCEQQHWHFMGWITSEKFDAGTAISDGDLQTPTTATNATYYAVWAKGSGGGSSGSFTITASDITTGPASYSTSETKFTKLVTNDFGYKNISYNNSNTPTNWAAQQRMQFKKDASNYGELYNLVAIDGLTKIRIYDHSNSPNLTIYTGTTSKATTSTLSWPASATGTEDLTIPRSTSGTLTFTSNYYDFTVSNNHTFFYIKNGNSAVAYPIKIVVYYSTATYSDYKANCCSASTLAFAASPYATIRQDIGGASTTTWAEVDVTFTSNNTTGTISATTYTDGKTVYKLSSWEGRGTTGGTLCANDHAYFEVLTQPSGETPGTGKFHVKTTSGQTGQGTYRIALTQESTDESHGNFCETTVYGFVDVTLRDKFVDAVNDNGTVNKDGHGAQLATPLLSEFGTQVENACHEEGRKLKGWIKETDLKAQYETGNSTRVQTIDGLCETCSSAADQKSLVIAPGTDVTMSGATWYAVWAYER